MRQLRACSADEFKAFVAGYAVPLTFESKDNGLVVYSDTSDGSVWPDSLVASYLMPQPPKRPRASGYRIPA